MAAVSLGPFALSSIDVTDPRQRMISLYGTDALDRPAGVVHVAAVGQRESAAYEVIAVGPGSPSHPLDRFALDLTRARADVIVTTGAILRAEPELRYSLDGEHGEALLRWRADGGRSEPPLVVVLTRGRDVDPRHPTFDGWARPIVFTTSSAAERLRPEFGGVEIVGHPAPSLRSLIEWAFTTQRAETIAIEAGPSSVRSLYDDPVVVDELVLSVFGGPLRDSQCAGPFVGPSRLHTVFEEPHPASTWPAPGGDWCFHRFVRPPR